MAKFAARRLKIKALQIKSASESAHSCVFIVPPIITENEENKPATLSEGAADDFFSVQVGRVSRKFVFTTVSIMYCVHQSEADRR